MDKTNEKTVQRGGARVGAGRKRTLPEGSKVTTFALTEEERLAVKQFIVNMRRDAEIKRTARVDVRRLLVDTFTELSKVFGEKLMGMDNYRSGAYRKAVSDLQRAADIGCRDALCDWENRQRRMAEDLETRAKRMAEQNQQSE